MNMLQKLAESHIVCVSAIDHAAAAVPLAQALFAGGLKTIEVTFRTPEAARCIAAIRAAMPGMLVGAGTVLTPEQVAQAKAAGAQFAMAPGLNESVLAAAQRCAMPFIPGVMTPSEIERALQLGCTAMKFFPAEMAGGIGMIKALAGPYAHLGLKLIPTGGISAGNLADYLAQPLVIAVGGSWMVERKLIHANDWPKITSLAAEAARIAAKSPVPGTAAHLTS
jgi:2-dehydro-3-deoxyphosphogluconate aldolase / (4S)-4-hydroxy-2-oxoglutarate aldolase